MLKEERQRKILDLVEREGRVVATQLQDVLSVSGYTIRRDLDELAEAGRLHRVHGGALPRSTVPRTYAARSVQSLAGKIATARAAATLLEPDQVAILDGGSTALQLVEAIPEDHTGTFITHSPPIADALGRRPGIDVVVVGGVLDRRAMVTLGAQTLETFSRFTADICFLGLWSIHAEHGISNGYYEEAEVERVMVERADRVVGLATREKLGTVAPFTVGPATKLTHLVTEADAAPEILRPFAELGIHVVQGQPG